MDVEPKTLSRITWETNIADQIRKEMEEKKGETPDGVELAPFMIAITGIPGSGKTTSSAILSEILADMGVMVLPLDGYHFPLATLRSFPDAEAMIYRRGAPDTFDIEAFLTTVKRIRHGDEAIVKVSEFDHARGDPEHNALTFERKSHRLVICEGLYLLHTEDTWVDVINFFDVTLFINADVDLCIERLKIRNKCIPGYTAEEIDKRCEEIDRTNAMTVQRSKSRARLIVESASTRFHTV